MIWHALASVSVDGSTRTALKTAGGLFDLAHATLALEPEYAGILDCSVADMLGRWALVAPALATLAERLAQAGAVAPLGPTARLIEPYRPARLFCAASNFIEHANEMGTVLAAKAESEPYVFLKADSCVVGPEHPVVIPTGFTTVDWEVELAAVIGIGGKAISAQDALAHVVCYTIFNDISARTQNRRSDFPFKHDWFRGKSYDTFGPLGPWLVPAALLPDPQDVPLQLDLNGERMQDGTTRDMIFTLAEQIAYLSKIVTLRPGDLIATGTPTGVGMGRGLYLKPGDEMVARIPEIGWLRNPVVAAAV